MASDDFDAFTRYVNPALSRFLRVSERDFQFTAATGAELTTRSGERYTDWVSGFGTLSFGHRPAFALAAARAQLESAAPHLYTEQLNPFAGRLARELVSAAGPDYGTCFFANGGAEAVEAAIKTAALASGRTKILYLSDGYHGTTLGALSAMGQGLYRQPFESLLSPAFECVPAGDIDALGRRLAERDVGALLLEPIQMEAGARIFDSDYLEQLQALCERYGTLSIFDEIQTGLGRTGELFAFQHTRAKPDVVLLGKALGAGLVPISVSIFKRGVWERAYDSALRSEIHNSTLGGNALGCAVALAVLGELTGSGLLAQVRERSEQLSRGLAELKQRHSAVERVSLRGLLGGIRLKNRPHPWATWSGLGMPELEPNPSLGALLLQRLGKFGILAHVCGHDWSVLRIEPPLIISAQQCDAFLAALDSSLEWLEQNVIEA